MTPDQLLTSIDEFFRDTSMSPMEKKAGLQAAVQRAMALAASIYEAKPAAMVAIAVPPAGALDAAALDAVQQIQEAADAFIASLPAR